MTTYRQALIKPMPNTALHFYTLDNDYYAAKNSIETYLGYSGRVENWLYDLLDQISKYSPIDSDLMLEVQDSNFLNIDGRNTAIIRAQSLIAICNILISAKKNGFLYISEYKYANQAESFLTYLQMESIETVIDILSGRQLENYNLRIKLRETAAQLGISLAEWMVTLDNNFITNLTKVAEIESESVLHSTNVIAYWVDRLILSRLDDETYTKLLSSKPKRKYGKFNGPVTFVPNSELKRHVDVVNALLLVADFKQTILLQLLDKIHPQKRESIAYAGTTKRPESKTEIKVTEQLIKILRNEYLRHRFF